MEPRTALLRELTGGLVASLRAEVARVMETPSEAGREALARRIHGLAGRASRMELSLLADELSTCHAIATAIDEELGLEDGLRRDLEEGLERVAQFAQNELARAQGRPAPERRRQSKKPRMGTSRVALFAPETTVDSLLAEDWASEDESAMLAAERLTLTKTSHHDMRRKKPDVIVVDGDLDLASRFVEQLMLHNDTDGIPVIVLGTWDQAEDAAGFIALGAARTLPKPVSPSALRAACHDVGPEPGGGFEPLGECTLDALGARLAAELHRGLCDAAEDDVRRRRVDLGDGAEVLTVMWEAIGRMRELVTAKTGGRLRFERVPALDALPRAPWLRGSRRQQAADRAATQHEVREPGVVAEAALAGATIVIAEDDLSTNWFLSGVLREAGAEVHSVYDGRKALDHAYLHTPDLIISDVVMPDLDGFTLCRAVKRDVLLRSAPVVLLSWKADLLQRVRELGAGADGYLLKEASGEELLQRVMEVLRPRRAIARRLAQGGEVRGRLDGLTPYALLKLVARERPNARITLRDANHLYEVEMRSGRPVLATRTRTDGTSERGRGVMAAIVGVGAGRFGVEELDTGSAFTAELDGSLDEQLLEPIARMRAAQGLVSGQSLMRVGRVQFDEARLALPLAATPEPSRGLMRALAAGASPRDLVGAGRASAELIEGVLSDAARHHAVSAILTPRGLDMLPAAVDRELAVLSGEADEQAVRMSYAFLTGALPAAPAFEDDDPPLADLSEVSESAPVEASTAPEDEASWDDEELDAEEADHDEPRDGLLPEDLDLAVGVLEQDDEGIAGPLGRVSRPPGDAQGQTPVLASAVEVAEHARHHTPVLSRVDEPPRFAELDPAPVEEPPAPVAETPVEPSPPPAPARRRRAASAPDGFREEDGQLQPTDGPRVPRLPMPSAWAAKGEAPPPPKGRSWVMPLVFGVLGVGLAVGARWYREQQPYAPPAPVPAPLPTTTAPPQMEATPEAVEPARPRAEESPDEEPEQDEPRDLAPAETIELPLTKTEIAKLDAGQGLLEIVAGQKNKILVGGKKVGRGPVVKVPLAARPDPYEVRVQMKGEERVRYVIVKEGVRVRLRVAPPWSR